MSDPSGENRPIEQPTLKELGATVAEAAGVATTLWVSYLFVLFYMLVAAAGVTHQDLFLQSGIKLPFLSVELPLQGFFVLGPLILLVVHAYVLLHFVLFADKARRFAERRSEADEGEAVQELMPVNLFLQMLAAPLERRRRPTGRVSAVIAWATLVVIPVLLLVFFQLQFLPFHSEWITWWHRGAVLVDLGLLWWLWPKITCVNEDGLERPRRRLFERIALGAVSFAACYLAFLVATWSGEPLEAVLPSFPLHETLVAGPVDDATLRPSSPWSNRLVLASIDLLDHAKYDTPAKLATAAALHSFRARHLEHIVLTDATLPRSDFSSAHLEGASFVRVRAQGSWFDQGELEGANFDNSQLQGASFFSAHMPAASFQGAMLQGGRLAGATLDGAWFAEADLAAASLAGSDLRYAMLGKANLRGASLDGAQLQGASLQEAQLEGASLDGVSVWKTDFGRTVTGPRGFRIGHVAKLPCKPCDNADVPQQVHDLLMRYTTGDNQTRELAWLKPELGPGPLPDWSADSQAALDRLETVTLTADDAELSNLWGGIVCSGAGAPFVLETLIDTVKEPGWTRPQYREGMIALVDRLLTDKHCAAQPAISDATKMQVLDLPWARERASKRQDEAHITGSP